MSDCYDNYHRWEPLAEFHFNLNNGEDELYSENYIYCLCSRVLTREAVKTYEPEKYGSESDVDMVPDMLSSEIDDHSHVHFSVDTSYKVKCDKDEGASCYCSASHTDNYCSTDEHDGHIQASHALQPSDSGADLTYQDYHLDYATHDKLDEMDEDILKMESCEDYLVEDTWEKFWAVHGERLIWASWIKKYSDYINPDYLDENNDLLLDENSVPQKHEIKANVDENKKSSENIRERKYSYDSKINPCVKGSKDILPEKQGKNNKVTDTKDDTWVSIGRRRSSSEHERIVSPRTLAATDSMTNVTKATLSSYNVTSSHVTSDSSPTDGYSITSSTSDDQFNDQTRIVNVDYNSEQIPSEELDNDQYWQLLWKKHFGEQYALHYAYYIEVHAQNKELPNINKDKAIDLKIEETKCEIEYEIDEMNTQELPSLVEVEQEKIKEKDINIENAKENKPKADRYKHKNKVINSVGALLQHLLKEQKENGSNETTDAGDEKSSSEKADPVTNVTTDTITTVTTVSNIQTDNSNLINHDNDDNNEPPEERTHSLKRSHELDAEEIMSERIKSTFEVMGFCLDYTKLPKGELIYKKRIGKLRPPRNKKWGTSRKTYFDDDGNPYNKVETDDEAPIPSDREAENTKVESSSDKCQTESNKTESENLVKKEHLKVTDSEAKEEINLVVTDTVELNEPNNLVNTEQQQNFTEKQPSDLDTVLSDLGNKDDTGVTENQNQSKRRRRQKRQSRFEETDASELPEELKGEPKMLKYWKKRHSLFHRFDEGIRLDTESWFSVTPENVAAHIADRCAHDVILDAFCGAGGNAIQFARTCKKVIAIDIDPKKIELARHNAAVYGVTDNIEFIVGDFFEIGPTITADFVFLSPPWGGPKYSEHGPPVTMIVMKYTNPRAYLHNLINSDKNSEYDIETMLEPKPASELINLANSINSNIALYLPRNSKTDQIVSLAHDMGTSVEIEQSFLDRRFVAITAYFY